MGVAYSDISNPLETNSPSLRLIFQVLYQSTRMPDFGFTTARGKTLALPPESAFDNAARKHEEEDAAAAALAAKAQKERVPFALREGQNGGDGDGSIGDGFMLSQRPRPSGLLPPQQRTKVSSPSIPTSTVAKSENDMPPPPPPPPPTPDQAAPTRPMSNRPSALPPHLSSTPRRPLANPFSSTDTPLASTSTPPPPPPSSSSRGGTFTPLRKVGIRPSTPSINTPPPSTLGRTGLGGLGVSRHGSKKGFSSPFKKPGGAEGTVPQTPGASTSGSGLAVAVGSVKGKEKEVVGRKAYRKVFELQRTSSCGFLASSLSMHVLIGR